MDKAYLELKNVTKLFGGLSATNDLTLSIRKGELVSIIGPNGAGKTTLLNLISGILPITKGQIWFKGQRIDRLPAHRISGLGIARSFQNMQLFNNMSVLENVIIGCHKRGRTTFPEVMLRVGRVRREEREAFERAMEKLSFLGLEKKVNEVPSSLVLKERKFLGIARALATEPDLLLLDEPVGGLTVEEIHEAGKKILRMQEQGITILFIEHRMELVTDFSERVIVMDFGQKIAEGTFSEVKRNKQVIAAYLGKQIE
jgi:branched-chain amino acid transport system ATP-binding protein